MPLMTNSEELGWQRGLAEGRQEGRQEGAQQFTLRLLERQVGPLDEATRSHIAALPPTELEDLGLALSGSSSAADLQRWFDRQIAN
jgi:predicted transposase YdaD